MKKFFKISGIVLVSILALTYLLFLIIPPFINLDKYKADIQKLVLDNSKLSLNYSNLKIYTTPLLSIGVIIEDIDIKLPDNSTLVSTPKVKMGIALPSLLTLTIKTAKCSIENPNINLEIVDDEQYKIVSVVEDLINELNAKPKTEAKPNPPIVDEIIKRIRIKVPSIKITEYAANIIDLKNSHNLSLKGDVIDLGYNSARNTAKVNADLKLLSDNKENINALIKFSTSIPKIQPNNEQKDPDEKIAIPFVNPVKIYQTYDLKMNLDSRLKVRESKKRGFVVYGYANIDDLNLKLSDIRLPNSYLHTKFQGKHVKYESDISAKDNEKISLNGDFKFGKRPRMKTNIITDEIHFSNLLDMLEGLFDSLNIKNNLKSIKATGYLQANTTIKTNFKKLKSNGFIVVKDGSFVNPVYNIGIKDIVVSLLFDDNALNIKDTKATINGSKLSANGFIDSKANTEIKVDVDNLSLPQLYNSFAPKELKNSIKLNNANLTLHTDIKGKLDKLNAKLEAKLNSLALSDAKNTMQISNNEAKVSLNATPEKVDIKLNNSGFKLNLPLLSTNVKVNQLALNVDNEKIVITPFDILYNDLSKINLGGSIKDYTKDCDIQFFADGLINTQNLRQTLGKELSFYIPSKGILPVKASIVGDLKKQNVIAQIYADSNNFISPITLTEIENHPSIIQADVTLKGNKIKIKDSGLFKLASSGFGNDLSLNIANAKKLADFTTTIENNHINLLRLTLLDELSGRISIFNKSMFNTSGKVLLNGNLDDLSFGGDLKISNIDIPELLIKAGLVDLDFSSKNLKLTAKEVDLNGSKINASLNADLKLASVFKISDINAQSNLIDVDKALIILEKLPKYMPPVSTAPKKNTAPADIPLVANGDFDIKKLTTGNMSIENIKGDLAIKNNDLIVKNLNCNAFKGDINGEVKVNLLSTLISAKLKGKNIDANKMLTDAANMKDMISGNTKFNADISLKGATYLEQMKSLKGDVGFNIVGGQYGPFAKLENFFLAENIRENPVFKNTIGVILSPITTIDSTHFEELNGNLSFKDGIATLNSISSQGDILCILIKGNMNLINNTLDSNVRVRLASAVSDMLGPIAMANPVNLIKNTPGLNIATAKLFSVFTQIVTESDYKQIPDFSAKHSDANATKFQIVLNGDVAKPLKLVKSFKWLALQEDVDKANEFSANYIKEQEDLAKQALINKLQSEYEADNKIKVGVEKILQMDTTAPKVKELLVEEVIKTKQEAQKKAEEQIQKKKDEIKEHIETKAIENEQKVQEIKNQLKDKIKSQIKSSIEIPTTVNDSSAEIEQ